MPNRTILQDLANIRYEEAKTLPENGMYSGTYYLSGYMIELALKACIAIGMKEYDFPDKRIADKCHTHKLTQLFDLASLQTLFDKEIKTNRQLEVNWAIVINWSEESRYSKHEKQEAEDMFNAISELNGGVFEWIRQHW
jgi:HEPN domain-containing protein